VAPNLDFKRAMAPGGAYYPFQANIADIASVAASLLKYKKHEWILVAFEKARIIDLVWLNKGPDRTRVFLHLGYNAILNLLRSRQYDTVLFFHNHPNPDPSRYTMLYPSKEDHIFAKDVTTNLSQVPVNVLHFVCERGHFRKYHQSISESFIPIAPLVAKVDEMNGQGPLRNFLMHLENIF